MDNTRYWQGKIIQACHALHANMLAELPVGTKVTYRQGTHLITVEIIGHTTSDYLPDPPITVRGTAGNEYRINLNRIVGIAKEEG